ncbi:hypothetical protein M378DRAFT_160952 [Amanita muscaria Koide BX008]|uniref:Uncharacterized protein n=1 Tax=Amanita muscaria (strain Koide BX008) TaxID=946122 RepID=A0A0C2XC87_AMAMK|nr:hypothetical protein M378DRAFT_160952 [Amanita muscaria Koide BX008]
MTGEDLRLPEKGDVIVYTLKQTATAEEGARLARRTRSSSPVHSTKRNQDGCYCLTSLQVTAHLAWTPTFGPSRPCTFLHL